METSYTSPEVTYKLLFKENPHPLLLIDLHSFRILKVNKAAILKYGYDNNEFLGLSLAHLRFPEDQTFLPIPIKDENHGHYIETVIRHSTKSGEEIKVNILARLIKYKGLKVVFASINDITDTQDFEAKMVSAQMDAVHSIKESISKEIHDGLVQTLTASSIYFKSLSDNFTDDQGNKNKYEKGLHILTKGIDEARRLSHDLIPEDISNSDLTEMIEDLIDQSMLTGNIEFDFKKKLTSLQLSDDLKLNIYRMIQEIMQNIHKHAEARHVKIDLSNTDEKLRLDIQDDGKGFDQSIIQKKYKGIGFRNLRYRASSINGILNIFSEVNVGTRIVLRAPITKN